MKYHIITFGCQMNKADSEKIARVLENKGYKPASKINEADLIVVNMCSVRQSAVDRVYGLIPKFQKLQTTNYKLQTILTGCILKKDKKKLAKLFDEIVDIKDLIKDTKPKYSNKVSALVPIMTGCNNFCSYCVVPFTRGREVSRPPEEIICEVKKLVKHGYKEIWLLGQNVNSYGIDRRSTQISTQINADINFAKLLRMINDIPGKFRIRFTSSHPKDFSDDLIKAMAECKKVAKYLNLPVQSGDDKILKKMNRSYTVKQYKNLVKRIRKKIPDINLSTDVIVGFPGETKKQFENTVKLFKEIKYDIAYINKYSPRSGTAAAKLKDNVSIQEKKRREKTLEKTLKQKSQKNKLIVIVGPTASGKTDLSIKLAKKFNGEVISADSRQVYKGMDIGTGKITKKEMQGIPHYLLDVASPRRKFTVVQYRNLALKAIKKIQKKNNLPILVGGTGFYIQTVIDGIIIPSIKPDWKLRKKLEKKTTQELFKMLKKLDKHRAKTIESKNKRRLIRALEIIIKTKKPVPLLKKNKLQFEVLMLGVKKDPEELKERIKKRLLKRLKIRMVAEVKKLRKSGVSWKRLEEFGLEYKYIALYLQNKIAKKEMIDKIQKESEHFAKRQMTWFRRDQRIKWTCPHTKKGFQEIIKLCKEFLNKK